MTPTGLEISPDFPEEIEVRVLDSAYSSARIAGGESFETEVREIINSWPALPLGVRRAVLALIRQEVGADV